MHQTLTEFMEQYLSNSYDLAAILELVDDDAIYFFSNKSAHVGKEKVAAAIKKNFDTIQGDTYQISNLTWLCETADLAVCVYDFSWSGFIAEKEVSGTGRGTSVIKKHLQSWKVIHEHLSQGHFCA